MPSNLGGGGGGTIWASINMSTSSNTVRAHTNVATYSKNNGNCSFTFVEPTETENYSLVGSVSWVAYDRESPGLRIKGPYSTTGFEVDFFGGGTVKDTEQMHWIVVLNETEGGLS